MINISRRKEIAIKIIQTGTTLNGNVVTTMIGAMKVKKLNLMLFNIKYSKGIGISELITRIKLKILGIANVTCR